MLPNTVERMLMANLAKRINYLTDELGQIEKAMTTSIAVDAPQPLAVSGVGYDSTAALLIAVGDNSDRIKNQASFAALCRVSPVEFSSDQTQKRRLNHGGNRQANATLYRIALTRLRWDLATQEYLKNEPKTAKVIEMSSVA